MPEGFVSLATYLRGAVEVAPPSIEVPPSAAPECEPQFETCAEVADLIAGVKRVRAALADALDVALGDLLRDIAAAVLGRELSIAPADIAAIVAGALERFGSEMPVAVRVHPDEATALESSGVAVIADGALRRGDAVISVRSGTIDASLGVRLEELLREYGAW